MITKNHINPQNKTIFKHRTKGIKPAIKPAGIDYNLYLEIMQDVEYIENDPEVLFNISETLQQYIKPTTIETIIKYEDLNEDDLEYINNLFEEIYINEMDNGLIETCITPEAYNNKILELIKNNIEFETGADIEIGKDYLKISNPLHTKYSIGYLIENDLFNNIIEAVNKICYRLDENPDTKKELEQFIYLNSYYKE